MPPEVIIKKNAIGKYFFIVRDTEDKELATSKSFESLLALKRCLKHIRLTLNYEMQDIEGIALTFEITCKMGEYTFMMTAPNHEVLIQSCHHPSQEMCQRAIESCKNAFIRSNTSL